MSTARLEILVVSQMPASPPRFGAQARMHGLMTHLAQRHNVSAVMLVDEEFDIEESRRAMQAYCGEVVLIPNPHSAGGLRKRLLQLQSVASGQSFERLRLKVPALQQALTKLLTRKRFDVVNLEFPFLGNLNLRQAPEGEVPPVVVVNSHNIEFDLARQYARTGSSMAHRLYHAVNWPKLQREELETYRGADGVYLCSGADEKRLRAEVPDARTTIIPNAADVDYLKPRPTDPRPDGRTVLFFGLLNYVPNVDGVAHLIKDIWPLVVAAHPDARCKIVGKGAPRSLLDLGGRNVEFSGFVTDLRPHLASAALVVVPLRIGGGTRLKIVEAMAMGKAIVSTTIGAEGIEGSDGRDLLLADAPSAFAAAVGRLLDQPDLAARIGQSARMLAEERYAWSGAARALERFYRETAEARAARLAN